MPGRALGLRAGKGPGLFWILVAQQVLIAGNDAWLGNEKERQVWAWN